MNENIKKFTDPVKNFWGGLSKKVKTIFICVLVGVVIVAIGFVIALNTQPFVVLYPGLSSTEAVQIMNELGDRGVNYKEENGTIYIQADKENALRMELANLGYPKTAPNYDFFLNNTDIMSTDFEKKTIDKYQLNQRLESSIKTIDSIQNALVTISIPETTGYVYEENKPEPTASVTVTLNPGRELDAKQVNGIKVLVATAVPSLTTDNVAVVNTATGEEMNSSLNTQTDISQFKIEIEQQVERNITKKIQSQLRSLYGDGHFSVAVKSVVDIDKKIKEITTYTPSEKGVNEGVISKEEHGSEATTAGDAAGGVAGAETNTENDPATYPGVTTDGNKIYSKTADNYEYLVSKMIEQIQGDAATVSDVTVSVTIDQENIPQETKDNLAQMIAFAAGVTTDKVSIYNAVFPKEAVVEPGVTNALSPMVLAIGGGVLGLLFVLLMVSLLVAHRRKQRLLALAGLQEEPLPGALVLGEGEENPALESPIEDIKSKREAMSTEEFALQREIQGFSKDNPEIVAQLIRTLMNGGEVE